ncbi:ankyrin repeat and sterile alpha motif domain-containing protein 1B isoform X2 [Scaptodrosophila lebanonensis]|uniref:Ankyrin repeat and sterile alpha motif domain-containing protein 1B isoform X2 n=1 Tax=Drosophila lebanonensis TaxID=7225 RepID=A0A6J2SZ44_DROLE|nr:ankyrin repeat and sterile alpha motif domain-containing protein 1B isoform X2 [Scaptodrosophila lebanonensis]
MGKDQHLLEASRSGDIKTVGKLLELTTKRFGPLSSFRRSPSINCQDVNGYTSLHHACLNGHSSIVRLLLAHNAQLDVPDIRGSTPLFLASWAGHQDIVKMLLMHSPNPANPNAQTIENETPLHSGAQHGHNAVVAILLSYGADPTIRNNSFQTALDLAAQFGRLQVVQALLRLNPELIALYRRCKGDEMPKMFTHTCLHLASRNGHKKVVETLLAAGVDVNILTNAGSALHEAALCGKKSVVITLLNAGIDVYATDGNGRTALEILAEYPPHVTYDIVAVIKEFINLCEAQLLRSNQTELVTNIVIENGTHSLPKRLYEKNSQRQKQSKFFDLPKQRNSLDNYTTAPENYLHMKPIKAQKSVNDMDTIEHCKQSQMELWPSYQPVYKQPYQSALLQQSGNFSGGSVPSRSYEFINMLKNSSGSEDNSASSSNTQRPPQIAPYVEMALHSPVPAPRTRTNGDYANINECSAQPLARERQSATPPKSVDGNNNSNTNHKLFRAVTHSPTPDYPPPTVSEAENMISYYMQPLAQCRITSLDGASDSPRTTYSFSSDHVEEFVSDIPFAGLYKGSTLNLAQDELDGRNSVAASLRSPSMVRSVNNRRSLSKQRFSTTGEDFSASRVWAEIDTIFEHIGNEVSTVEREEPQSQHMSIDDDLRHSLHIRNPAELLLGKTQSAASHWCHSPYTLIYGEIRYTVFYLGSTVIRQLQGTISARKSIQKLKIDENFETPSGVSDFSLLENCNTSTKYLKAANLQTRLQVDIAVSCVGVKFIDHEKKTAICAHDIENINCVCQDVDDLRYFAYLTKEQELHYCHVFMVDSLELAKEIILTLGQAFEVAYQLALSRQGTPLTEEC